MCRSTVMLLSKYLFIISRIMHLASETLQIAYTIELLLIEDLQCKK